jgi:hypothetical protein
MIWALAHALWELIFKNQTLLLIHLTLLESLLFDGALLVLECTF